jgi:hypothetical protein
VLGVECSCGFKRRGYGREIEGLHYVEIAREAAEVVNGESPPIHSMSSGLIATTDWLPLTDDEQKIGESYWVGFWAGDATAKAHMKKRLDAVTAEEFEAVSVAEARREGMALARKMAGAALTNGREPRAGYVCCGVSPHAKDCYYGRPEK